MGEQKVYYQPTVELFRYNWFKGIWIRKEIFSSTRIFEKSGPASIYLDEYVAVLKGRGVKLKEGNFRKYILALSTYDYAEKEVSANKS